MHAAVVRERSSQSDPLQALIEGEHLAHLEVKLVEACEDNWRLKELLTAKDASQPALQGPRKCHAKLHSEVETLRNHQGWTRVSCTETHGRSSEKVDGQLGYDAARNWQWPKASQTKNGRATDVAPSSLFRFV